MGEEFACYTPEFRGLCHRLALVRHVINYLREMIPDEDDSLRLPPVISTALPLDVAPVPSAIIQEEIQRQEALERALVTEISAYRTRKDP